MANIVSNCGPLISCFTKFLSIAALQVRGPPSKYSRWHFTKYFAIIWLIFQVSSISVTAIHSPSMLHTLTFCCSNIPLPNLHGPTVACVIVSRTLATGFIIRIAWGTSWTTHTQRLQYILWWKDQYLSLFVFFFKLYCVWHNFL